MRKQTDGFTEEISRITSGNIKKNRSPSPTFHMKLQNRKVFPYCSVHPFLIEYTVYYNLENVPHLEYVTERMKRTESILSVLYSWEDQLAHHHFLIISHLLSVANT